MRPFTIVSGRQRWLESATLIRRGNLCACCSDMKSREIPAAMRNASSFSLRKDDSKPKLEDGQSDTSSSGTEKRANWNSKSDVVGMTKARKLDLNPKRKLRFQKLIESKPPPPPLKLSTAGKGTPFDDVLEMKWYLNYVGESEYTLRRCAAYGLQARDVRIYMPKFLDALMDDELPYLRRNTVLLALKRNISMDSYVIPGFFRYAADHMPSIPQPLASFIEVCDVTNLETFYPGIAAASNEQKKAEGWKYILHVDTVGLMRGIVKMLVRMLSSQNAIFVASHSRTAAYAARYAKRLLDAARVHGDDSQPHLYLWTEEKIEHFGGEYAPIDRTLYRNAVIFTTVDMVGHMTKLHRQRLYDLEQGPTESFDPWFDVVALDDFDLAADPADGWKMSSALMSIPGKEVHVYCDENVAKIVQSTLDHFGAKSERKVGFRPRELVPTLLASSPTKRLKPGDCIIMFSRAKPRQIAGEIFKLKEQIERQTSFTCAVVYPGLPAGVQSSEIRQFNKQKRQILILHPDCVGIHGEVTVRRVIFSSFIETRGREFFEEATSEWLNPQRINGENKSEPLPAPTVKQVVPSEFTMVTSADQRKTHKTSRALRTRAVQGVLWKLRRTSLRLLGYFRGRKSTRRLIAVMNNEEIDIVKRIAEMSPPPSASLHWLPSIEHFQVISQYIPDRDVEQILMYMRIMSNDHVISSLRLLQMPHKHKVLDGVVLTPQLQRSYSENIKLQFSVLERYIMMRAPGIWTIEAAHPLSKLFSKIVEAILLYGSVGASWNSALSSRTGLNVEVLDNSETRLSLLYAAMKSYAWMSAFLPQVFPDFMSAYEKMSMIRKSFRAHLSNSGTRGETVARLSEDPTVPAINKFINEKANIVQNKEMERISKELGIQGAKLARDDDTDVFKGFAEQARRGTPSQSNSSSVNLDMDAISRLIRAGGKKKPTLAARMAVISKEQATKVNAWIQQLAQMGQSFRGKVESFKAEHEKFLQGQTDVDDDLANIFDDKAIKRDLKEDMRDLTRLAQSSVKLGDDEDDSISSALDEALSAGMQLIAKSEFKTPVPAVTEIPKVETAVDSLPVEGRLFDHVDIEVRSLNNRDLFETPVTEVPDQETRDELLEEDEVVEDRGTRSVQEIITDALEFVRPGDGGSLLKEAVEVKNEVREGAIEYAEIEDYEDDFEEEQNDTDTDDETLLDAVLSGLGFDSATERAKIAMSIADMTLGTTTPRTQPYVTWKDIAHTFLGSSANVRQNIPLTVATVQLYSESVDQVMKGKVAPIDLNAHMTDLKVASKRVMEGGKQITSVKDLLDIIAEDHLFRATHSARSFFGRQGRMDDFVVLERQSAQGQIDNDIPSLMDVLRSEQKGQRANLLLPMSWRMQVAIPSQSQQEYSEISE
ncbi:hypothetical protein BJ742DRAFT_840536 [Cladochytrium replicatum]|nr:hypothetical protein BJ742DRAFT_840536 [Cladochytrium replicatum]